MPRAIGQGKGHGVEVLLVSPKIVETDSGKIVTTSFQISNKTDREEEFFDYLNLPAGWQLVTPTLPLRLRPRESQVKILAFSVPASSPGGRYELYYSLRSQRDYGISDSDTFSVVVLPMTRLELLVEEKPQTIIAGEPAVFRARLLNRSNTTAKIRFEVKSSPDYPFKMDYSEFVLDPGKSQVVKIEVKTDEKLVRPQKYVITIGAQAENVEGKHVKVDETFFVDLIPRITGDMDPYLRLPSVLSIIGVGEGKSAAQVEFSGAGTLDEKGERWVDFLFRSPDVQNKSIFGMRDEYRLNYKDSLLNVRLGDQTYALSPLTEFYRYGRGAGVDAQPGKFAGGAYYLETRWDRPEIKELGAHVSYQVNDAIQIKGNFLDKSAEADLFHRKLTGQIYSMEARVRPNEKLDLGLEYARSQSDGPEKDKDYAYRIDAKGNPADKVWYTFEKTYAGSRYFGYYQDVDYTSGAITFPIYGNLRGALSYLRNDQGALAYLRDIQDNFWKWTRTNANLETSYKGGLTYSTPSGTSVSLSYEDYSIEDRLPPAAYNFTERLLTLGVGQTFRKFSIQGYMSAGDQKDKLFNNSQSIERYSIYASYFPTSNLTFTLYGQAGDQLYTPNLERIKNLGASATWRIADRVNLNVNYQKNRLDYETKREQDNFYATATYTLPNRHFIDVKYRWYQYKNKQSDNAFLVSYSIPFGIPVGKKKGLGVLKGRVFDGERPDKSPLPKVILALNGATAVTNSQGEFTFPSIKPGTYRLLIERASIGVHRIPSEKLPMMIEIHENETTYVKITVVDSCTISGEVTIPADREGEKGNLARPKGMPDMLVEIKNGQETTREVTDATGRFSFKGIRPGKWSVQFHGDNLPAQHYIEIEQMHLELKPGEERVIVGNVIPRVPEILMIDGGEIKTEIRVSKR